MLDQSMLRVGVKVSYWPQHGGPPENGIIKELPLHTKAEVRVVYHCNNDWDNYQNYTSALTKITDLRWGWE